MLRCVELYFKPPILAMRSCLNVKDNVYQDQTDGNYITIQVAPGHGPPTMLEGKNGSASVLRMFSLANSVVFSLAFSSVFSLVFSLVISLVLSLAFSPVLTMFELLLIRWRGRGWKYSNYARGGVDGGL